MGIPNLNPVIFHFGKRDELKYSQGPFVLPFSKQGMLINEGLSRKGEMKFELT